MLLFRSEDAIDRWCAASGEPRGVAVPLETVWQLAQLWYGNRLDECFSGRSLAEAEAILARVGLTGEFWQGSAAE